MEDSNNAVSMDQMKSAQKYLAGYFQFAGMRYPYDMPETDEEIEQARKMWPKDAVAAMDTIFAFWDQMEEKRILP